MKFQNPGLILFLNGRTDAGTDARTNRNQYAPTFSKLGPSLQDTCIHISQVFYNLGKFNNKRKSRNAPVRCINHQMTKQTKR